MVGMTDSKTGESRDRGALVEGKVRLCFNLVDAVVVGCLKVLKMDLIRSLKKKLDECGLFSNCSRIKHGNRKQSV
jgi:hypothetical protein